MGTPADDTARIVNIGAEGRFSRDGAVRSSRQEVDALFAELDEAAAQRVLLFFHGGLVSEASGVASARALAAPLRAAGVEPLFFVWETGALEVLGRNVRSVLATELFLKLGEMVLRRAWSYLAPGGPTAKGAGQAAPKEVVAAMRDPEALAAIAIAPPPPPAESRQKAVHDTLLAQLQEDVAAASRPLGSSIDLTDEELAPRLTGAPHAGVKAKGPWLAALAVPLASATYQVVKRFWYKRDHGLHATIVEELLRALYLAGIGQELWGAMKKASDAMWASNDAVALDADLHGGSYVLAKLAAHKARHPGLALDVVAHSAGGIAACHLVRTIALRHPALSLRDLVLLAPACSVRLFADTIGSQAHRIARTRTFALSDAAECADALGAYPRSLLYLVSGAFEEERDLALLGMARHVSGITPYDESPLPDVARLFRAGGALSWVESPTAGDAPPGKRSTALHHGGFAHDPETLGSIVAMLGETA